MDHIVHKTEKLAAVGFYFTGQNELIKCFECDLEISEWPEGLRVVVFHKKFSSKCRFAHQLSCNNVPIDLDDRRRGKNVSDIKNVYDDMEHNEFMLDIETAKHPEYCFYQARLESFTSWSPAKYPIRSKLAESGFYKYRTSGSSNLLLLRRRFDGLGRYHGTLENAL